MVHRRPTVFRRTALVALTLLGCTSAPAPAPTVDAAVSTDVDHADHVDVAHEDAAHDVVTARDVVRADATPVTDRCPDGGALPYPSGTALNVDGPLPDLALPTGAAPLRLSRFYAPCASPPRVLMLRLVAAWSGPSQHHAAHTRRVVESPSAARLDLVDVLVSAADNLPPDDGDLADWRARYDVAPAALARSEASAWREFSLGAQQLPLVLLVDERTMTVLRIFDAPDTHDLAFEVADALARLDGRARSARPEAVLHDGLLGQDAWEMMQAMAPRDHAPPDPTNAFADDPRAAALGRSLFFDARLSATGTVACATCHAPATALADHLDRSVGIAAGDRNAPSIATAAGQRWQFWDGRADSQWSQALGPIENPREMGSSRLALAHAVADRYAAAYTAVYGALPPLADAARFPAEGRPGSPAWEAMGADDRRAVDRVFVNAGKSIAAYERTLGLGASDFDRYARGDVTALSAPARTGLRTFFDVGCHQCHHGPTLSDDSFHNIQFGTGRRDDAPDLGRLEGVDALRESPFRADGVFSDAPATNAHLRRLAPVEAMRGQFRTSTLRNVANTGPWGHGGTFPTLRAVVIHYARSGDRRDEIRTAGEIDPALGPFHRTEETFNTLEALLHSLSATVVVP